ncbi:MAG: type III-A CRISPR-associated RAMP protein Csm4 [Synergistetes bacterium]|nr:type III-A CRISPR-associated RAMP protein Csm4 [Synergistota bacterium]
MMIFKLFPGERALLSWKDLTFSSSSLFGGLSNAIGELYGEGELRKFIEAFSKNEINISSVFPMIRGETQDILFLPRPILPPKLEGKEGGSSIESKKIKRIKWLSVNTFFELGKSIVYDDSDKSYRFYYVFSNSNIFWNDLFYAQDVPAEFKREIPFRKVEVPHASIDRLDFSSNLFFTEDIMVKNPLGFYFLCEALDVWRDKIKNAVSFLLDEGLGGERSKGKGIFEEVKVEEVDFLPKVKKVIGYIGLSLTYPSEEEVSKIYSFSLVKDDGFVYMGGGRSIKKSRVMMLSEGSFYKGEVKGKLFEERSGNIVVFRNGKAFTVPVGDLS